MKLTCEIDGVKQLQGNIQRTIVHVRREAKKFVIAEAEEIMRESLEQVPVGTGALKSSAFIEADVEGNVVFGYGGPNAQTNPITGESTENYMMAVHERLDRKHPHGKAKFLEDPINKHQVLLEEKMLRRFRRWFRSGGK